jgi:hypothetical protein
VGFRLLQNGFGIRERGVRAREKWLDSLPGREKGRSSLTPRESARAPGDSPGRK